MFQTEVVENTKTDIKCSITLSQKSCHLRDTVEKNGIARQATDDHMAHVRCMLDD